MANTYPYVTSPGGLLQTVEHLRKSFPKVVNANTLRKLGVAPQNESYIVNVLRFLGVIDEEGERVVKQTKAFNQHDDGAFQKEFEQVVRGAYSDVFELHAEDAWELERGQLIQFFRTEDQCERSMKCTFRHAPAVAVMAVGDKRWRNDKLSEPVADPVGV